ncbi:MAG: branched-chain amino acid ABC transporter permease [Desulfobacteraceae bacterium]|nr:branched-chain amino acid ABC transporter permease [Desulfobacteraceae bacterium]
MNYILHLTIYLSIYIILASSLNIVVGYCGLLTLAHAAYFAIGCYSYAITTLYGWGFVPSLAVGVGVAMLLSLFISLPAWRFRGDFFVIVSLAVQALLFSLFYNWNSPGADPGTLKNLTNGPFGIAGISKPDILGIRFDTIGDICVLSIILAGTCLLVSWLLLSSPWGRLLKAVRDDELVARGLGKNTRLVKIHAFAVACGMAAVSGVIYASYVGYIDPSSASLDESILMLCMVMVGGVGNIRGPIVGALVLLLIPEALRFLDIPDTVAANIRLLAYGLLLIFMMHFRPQGLAGVYRVE